MRHGLSGRKLRRPTSQRILMLRTLVTDLIQHESITTTEARAKEVRRMAEKVITHGKKGSLHDRRQVASLLTTDNAVRKVFDELPGRYVERKGGYTRIAKLGPRKGDAAPMAMIDLMP
ncbi:MAG: 50S ribosomal protein L17 [Chloroflexi bacterium]|nr:50S ribosomal protein L17 [Chloroflexota bacterium]